MKLNRVFAVGVALTLAALCAAPLPAEEPLIPPSISKISPAGMERGTTVTFTLEGRNLKDARAILFDAAGIEGKVTDVTDIAEKIEKAKAGVDLDAQVPQGQKESATLEIRVDKNVLPGIHWLRIQTPLGTTNSMPLDIGFLPEVSANAVPTAGATSEPREVQLPTTLVGTISTPGAVDRYQFEGKSGQELVFQVQASQLGSELESLVTLSDSDGHQLAQAGKYENGPDAKLAYKLTKDGKYNLSITDRERGGSMDHFYRVNAGALPYISGVFPLGVRAGSPETVTITGFNLAGKHEVKVVPPKTIDGWTTIPLEVQDHGVPSLNKVELAVGTEPEMLEREPNNSIAEAEPIHIPVTINGHIEGGHTGDADVDYFRFHAKKGQELNIAVAASRLGSPLDSVIEVLDANGKPIPRATIRCLNQTTTTLSDRDSRNSALRLTSLSGLHVGDYVMIGDELDRIENIPDQPDEDTGMESVGGLRKAFLGTSPDLHAINTLVYRAQVLPAGADLPANGLPVFHLTWRNDDGGPGYGADSKLDFVAPEDGDYLIHLTDVRGLEGPNYAYRLTVRDAFGDYRIWADPVNPNVPQGGSTPVRVTVDRHDYVGPIDITVHGLSKNIHATDATIPAGQDSTIVILSADANTPLDSPSTPFEIIGHARIDGREVARQANATAQLANPQVGPQLGPLQIASVIPPPDVVVTTDPREVSLQPGKSITVTLHVTRQNGFKGRVPCYVQNLPPGVRVVNVGLNGVLVTETQTSRTFVLKAEDWAKPVQQPIYVVAEVESNSPTMHPSAPLMVEVPDQTQLAANHVKQSGKETAEVASTPSR